MITPVHSRISVTALLAALAMALSLSAACTESKQSSAPPTAKGQPVAPLPPAGPTPPLGEPDPTQGEDEIDCDPDKDFAKLDFPAKVSECLKQEKLYNFDAEDCTPMNKAITFDCTFDGVKSALSDIGLSSSPLDKEKSKGGKLIGCGASNNGFVIVAQFFYKSSQAPKNDCTFSKQGKVVSVCFRRFGTETPPPAPTTDAEKKRYVAECLEQE